MQWKLWVVRCAMGAGLLSPLAGQNAAAQMPAGQQHGSRVTVHSQASYRARPRGVDLRQAAPRGRVHKARVLRMAKLCRLSRRGPERCAVIREVVYRAGH